MTSKMRPPAGGLPWMRDVAKYADELAGTARSYASQAEKGLVDKESWLKFCEELLNFRILTFDAAECLKHKVILLPPTKEDTP